MKEEKQLELFSWALGLTTVLLAFIVWCQSFGGQFDNLSAYQIFPLLGLIAFSLMWTHYILGAAKKAVGVNDEATKKYFEVTGFIVLLAIVLHPGLLIYQLWADGFGLPPGSVYENYVAPSLKWAVTLGPVALMIFLAYELRRKFGQQKWWKLIDYAQLVAMAAIFVHALKLGSHLQDWYLFVWWFFGASLITSAIYSELAKRRLVTSLKNRNNKSAGGAA